MAVELDGTLKLMKKDSIGSKTFDSKGNRDSTSNGAGGTYCALSTEYGCNAWIVSNNFVNGNKSGTVLKNAELNTYLNSKTDTNSYYNKALSDVSKGLIQEHSWGIGAVTYDNTDLSAQIASENGTTWIGNVGLISVSDYIRANSNTEKCGDFSLNGNNKEICKTTNYIVPTSGFLWTISPYGGDPSSVFSVSNYGVVYSNDASRYSGVYPAVYLKSDITLSGEGTLDNLYTIN